MKPLYLVVHEGEILKAYKDKESAKFIAKELIADNLWIPDDVAIYSVNCGEIENG